MQTSMIYSKLKSFFPNDIENINFSQMTSNLIDESHTLSFLISSSLPHLPIDQIHTLCRKQQKNVLEKIMEIKKIDLYHQIATVCPSQKDLKHMPIEQVTIKINQYNPKMDPMQDSMDSMESQSDYDHSISDCLSKDFQQIDDEGSYESEKLPFFQDDNAHLPWNPMGIYDLS